MKAFVIILGLVISSFSVSAAQLDQQACNLDFQQCANEVNSCEQGQHKVEQCHARIQQCQANVEQQVNSCKRRANEQWHECITHYSRQGKTPSQYGRLCLQYKSERCNQNYSQSCGSHSSCPSAPVCNNPQRCDVNYQLCMRKSTHHDEGQQSLLPTTPRQQAPENYSLPKPSTNHQNRKSTPQLSSELYLAAIRSNPQKVAQLLAQGANVNMPSDDELPLYAAAGNSNDNTLVVKLLIDAGARLDGVNKRSKKTALHAAAQSKNFAITKLLIKAGADVNLKSVSDFTPLHISASQNPDREIMKLLVQNGADVNARTAQKITALEYITYKRSHQAAAYLIEAGTDVNISLRYAATNGMFDVVKQCLKKGADVNANKPTGRYGRLSPLMMAARHGHDSIIKLLLSKGANIKTKDRFGDSPFILAVRSGSLTSIKLLHKTSKQEMGNNTILNKALIIATHKKNPPKITAWLLSKGADIDTTDVKGNTALHHALIYGNTPVVKQLLQHTTKLNIKNKRGRTPLHTAIASNKVPIQLIQQLIKLGADVNLPDNENKTALHHAVKRINPKIVELLLAKGAKQDIKDNKGNTAFDIAEQYKLSTIIELFDGEE